MPVVVSNGQRLHVTATGSGPLVVLLHGLLMAADDWQRGGVVAALGGHYRVARLDPLGHGRSDRPIDPAAYAAERQARHVVAVIDALGEQRAHVVGYSSGAWLALAVARHHAGRLASLVLGGWDVVHGLPSALAGRDGFSAFIAYARRRAPELTERLDAAGEAAAAAALTALTVPRPVPPALLDGTIPALAWAGRDDPCHGALV